jgi:hypothetical protein
MDVTRFTVAVVAIALAACSRNIQNKEAVQRAIMDYLNSRQAQTGLDMSVMTMEVNSMTFEKDQARAGVYFKLKSGEGGMEMQYALDRKGNQWVVRGLTGVGSGPHGPGTSATDPEATPALPPNHPKIDGHGNPQPAGGLPPGHPEVGSQQ